MQTAQIGASDWLAQYSDDPDRVREFCTRHGLLDHLRTAVALAQKNFPPIERLTVRPWTDPLEGTEKVRIFVIVRAGLTEASDAYWRFLDDWTRAVALPERDRITLRYVGS